MTDSQTWTIIAAMVSLVGVVSVLFFRSQRAMMAGIDQRFDAVDGARPELAGISLVGAELA